MKRDMVSITRRVLYAALFTLAVGCTSTKSADDTESTPTSTIESTTDFRLTASPTDTPVSTSTRVSTPVQVVTTTPTFNEQGYAVIVDEYDHTMVHIPAGSVILGISEEQEKIHCMYSVITNCGLDQVLQQFPSSTTSIEKDYWIDVFEVSNAQYDDCVEAGICQRPPYGFNNNLEYYFEERTYDNYPVSAMTYQDAVTYCEEWRGARLPTELEWEYAARGSDGRLWPWGNSPEPGGDFGDFMNSYTIGDSSSVGLTQPVDAYPLGVSSFGVYNMAGNVEEFVSIEGRLYPPESQTDLIYVVRGGDFYSSRIFANTYYSRATGEHPLFGTGFRCARDMGE